MSTTRHLIVMRHAASQHAAATDHARRLTPQGGRDAIEAGQWLAAHELRPEVLLVSSAARAQDTASGMLEGVAAGLTQTERLKPDLRVLDELYDASAIDVLGLVQGIADTTTCAAVVGHNPTMAMTAQLLDREAPKEGRFAPGALAVFEVPGSWAALESAAAALVGRFTPRD